MKLNIATGRFVAAICASVMACASANAAEVFAEPVSAKGARGGYQLSVFPSEGEEGVSFVMQLPRGLKNLDLSRCGREAADGVAKCHYSADTGKLAVVLFRLDGKPLAMQEYKLGQVAFARSGREALSPLQVENVTSASRSSRPAAPSEPIRSTNAER